MKQKQRELTESELAEVASVQAHFPYRHVYAVFDEATDKFKVAAVSTLRIPNALARAGLYVVLFRKG